MNEKFLEVGDVMQILGISRSAAYKLMRQINSELEKKGYIVIRGKVSRKYFEERIYGMKTIWIKQGFGSLWTVMDESEKADIEVNNLSDILNYL